MKRTGSIGSRVPPGGDEHGAGQVAAGSGSAAHRLDRGHDRLGLGQAAVRRRRRRPGGPTSGSTTCTPRGPQHGEVVLHRRVLPHLGVHGRAHDHRGPGGEQRWP